MSNLLVTVISISLVALLAISGVYYGGSYYTAGQSHAAADSLLNMGLQISRAYTNMTNDHNYVQPQTWSSMINGGYINEIPTLPSLGTNSYGKNIDIVKDGQGKFWLWGDLGLSTQGSGAGPGSGQNNSGPSAAVCLTILKIALGTQSTTIITTGINHAVLSQRAAGTGNGNYGCVINLAADNDPGAIYYMQDDQVVVPDNHYAFFYLVD